MASEWPTWGWSRLNSDYLGVLQLQMLPLETATVIVSRNPFFHFQFMSMMIDGVLYGPRMAKDELAAAEGLRNQLLDPDGMEVWKQQMKIHTESIRRSQRVN